MSTFSGHLCSFVERASSPPLRKFVSIIKVDMILYTCQ